MWRPLVSSFQLGRTLMLWGWAAFALGGCVPASAPGAPPTVATAAPAPSALAETCTPTPSATATLLPSPTATVTPSPTATATPTVPPSPTATPTLAPTATQTPVPTPVVSAREVLRGNPHRPWVALTFDADAAADPAPRILDTLKAYGVRATFFVQGWWAERHPDLVRRMVEEGHEIGNHSNTHPDFRTLTREEMVRELADAEAILQRVAGRTSKPFFRPPYSYRNQLVWEVAAEEGYLTVVWTIDVFDWKPDATQESILREVLDHVVPGAIIVLHVGDENSAAVLPRLIEGLRGQGYEPVSLSEVLAP